MRVHLKLQATQNTVPFNYQPQITGAFHKWIGQNNLHDATSLYSFSWLSGGEKKGDGLVFKQGATLHFSAYDDQIIKKLIEGIQLDPYINFGLTVTEVMIQQTPDFTNKEVFFIASPVLIKRTEGEREIHYTYEQPEADVLLTETIKNKLRKAGLDDSNITIAFDKSYQSPKTKLVYYKSIGNKANMCPVIIEGTPQQIAFAWNVGVGNSTGIGFGALK